MIKFSDAGSFRAALARIESDARTELFDLRNAPREESVSERMVTARRMYQANERLRYVKRTREQHGY